MLKAPDPVEQARYSILRGEKSQKRKQLVRELWKISDSGQLTNLLCKKHYQHPPPKKKQQQKKQFNNNSYTNEKHWLFLYRKNLKQSWLPAFLKKIQNTQEIKE